METWSKMRSDADLTNTESGDPGLSLRMWGGGLSRSEFRTASQGEPKLTYNLILFLFSLHSHESDSQKCEMFNNSRWRWPMLRLRDWRGD